ncbi:energy transducer TonB [SAR86 cluster bacterium]|nr:energy transducer TonB [SAR86 cluster bacterium]
MKLIKILTAFLITIFSLSINATDNPKLKKYFEKIYKEEKDKFLQCVALEGLPKNSQVYSNCDITEKLSDAAFILFTINNIDAPSLLDHIKKYSPIKKEPPTYPSSMLKKLEMGYVIVKFDISKSGITKNHVVLEGFCGNIYNPLTVFKPCKGFNNSSLIAAKKLRYHPLYSEGSPIDIKDIKHRFTFLLEEENKIQINKGVNAYKKLIRAINTNEFEKALTIANENIENDSYFLYQMAIVKYYMNEFEQSISFFKKFLEAISRNNKGVEEKYFVMSFSMQVASLFNLGKYQEVVNMEKNYKLYSHERKKYEELLSITNFYIGASFINIGNFHKGAYYIALADKASSSKGQSDYFNTVIDQISIYL